MITITCLVNAGLLRAAIQERERAESATQDLTQTRWHAYWTDYRIDAVSEIIKQHPSQREQSALHS